MKTIIKESIKKKEKKENLKCIQMKNQFLFLFIFQFIKYIYIYILEGLSSYVDLSFFLGITRERVPLISSR